MQSTNEQIRKRVIFPTEDIKASIWFHVLIFHRLYQGDPARSEFHAFHALNFAKRPSFEALLLQLHAIITIIRRVSKGRLCLRD